MTSKKNNPGCLGIFRKRGSKKPPFLPTAPQIQPPALLPYAKCDKFLSDGELRFHHVLKPLVPTGYSLITKVRLGDLFFVRRPHENKGARNKIDRKHVDFVICENSSMQPALAIELDDSSHNRKDRIERDLFVDQIFKTAGLPLIHVKVVQSYDADELAEQIKSGLSSKL